MKTDDILKKLAESIKEESMKEWRDDFLNNICKDFMENSWNLDRMENIFNDITKSLGSKYSARLFVLYLFGYMLVNKKINIRRVVDIPILDESGEVIDEDTKYGVIADVGSANDALVEENDVWINGFRFSINDDE